MAVATASDFAGIVVGAVLVDRMGRRVLVVLGFIGGAIGTVLIVYVEGVALLALTSGGQQLFQAWAWIVMMVYVAESYPTEIRAAGLGVALSLSRLLGTAGSCAAAAEVAGNRVCERG